MAILFGTLLPADQEIGINVWEYDKLVHFLAFGVWTFLYGMVRAVRKRGRPNLWVIFILGTSYGLLVEFLQLVLPTNRSPELLDFIADMLGSGAAIIVLHFLFKSIFNEKESPV